MMKPSNIISRIKLHYRGSLLPVMMNVVGMSIAFVAFIVIMIQVRFDVTYDKFHEKSDRLFMLHAKYIDKECDDEDNERRTITFCSSFMQRLLVDKPEQVKNVSFSVMSTRYKTLQGAESNFATGCFTVDSSFVDMFSFDVVAGSLDDFKYKSSVAIIPESMAMKHWGTTDIIGRELWADGYKVAAVYRDFPANSMLMNNPYLKLDEVVFPNWSNWAYTIMLELDEADSHDDVEMILNNVLDDDIKPDADEIPLNVEEWTMDIVPIHELHYMRDVSDFNNSVVSKDGVLLLFIVSLLIVLIAGFNFTNFSISSIPKRIKSVNIHRILGAGRRGLMIRIVGESVLLVCLSWLIAVVFLFVFADEWLFGTASARVNLLDNYAVFGVSFVLALVIGILVGLYPALYLTRGSAQLALKRHFGLSKSSRVVQDVLLTAQLFCSLTLIVSSYTMLLQERYLYSGGTLDKEHLLFCFMKDTIPDAKPLYDALRAVDDVEDVALSRQVLTSQDEFGSSGWNKVVLTLFPVSVNYLEVHGIEMVEGRTFTENDKYSMIFNETAQKKYPNAVKVGEKFGYSEFFEGFQIVGVCKDVNFSSLREAVAPMAFIVYPNDMLTCINVRIKGERDLDDVKSELAAAADLVDVNYKHSFKGLDEIYVSTYSKERFTINRITLFALVAIIISLMGVCGMVIMNSEYHVKEMAVKQTFGASVKQLLIERMSRYLAMLAVALLLCLPVFYCLVVEMWMNAFYYHIDVSWMTCAVPFVLTIAVVLAVALLFMWRYMRKKPADVLKYE